ncbi:MAG: signal peptidase I [Clostridia bacterium]|nr:signal peptidase I [Clostridia bacterium]
MDNNEVLKEKALNFRKDVFDWLDILVSAVVAVIIIFCFLFRVVTIQGESMENTLYENEKVIITNMFYEAKQGDIVVISRNTHNSVANVMGQGPIIKRVIATEGQYVDIDFNKGKVYVGYDLANMVELNEPYTKTLTTRKADIEFPVYVDEGCVFVLGDNRNDSLDSRFSTIGNNGLIDTRYILGHAVFRIFPLDRMGGLKVK